MAAQAAVDSRSGPASAHSETRRPRKYTLSPMTAIRLTSAARASSFSTRNSLCAPRPGATFSVPSGRLLTPAPPFRPLRSPSRPKKPCSPVRETSRASVARSAPWRASPHHRYRRPRRLPCAPAARRTRCARRPCISPRLLRLDNPDDGLARHDEHLAPAPLVVHEVRVDGRVFWLRCPDVAVVPERDFAHAGRKYFVVLDRPHQTTPTSLSCLLPSGVISFLDQVSHTTSMSTSSMPSISRSLSLTSSWIISIAGQPMQVYVNFIFAFAPSTSTPRMRPRSTRLMGYSGSNTSLSASHASSTVTPAATNFSCIARRPPWSRALCIHAADARRTPRSWDRVPSSEPERRPRRSHHPRTPTASPQRRTGPGTGSLLRTCPLRSGRAPQDQGTRKGAPCGSSRSA